MPGVTPRIEGVQLAPSLSVYSIALVGPSSWLTNVRPARVSVNRIGSSVRMPVSGPVTSAQVATPAGSKRTRKVCTPATNITAPVLELTPIDGSPESMPSGAGAG